MPFGYVPDYRDRRDLVSTLKDIYLRLFGMPFYAQRVGSRFVFHTLGQVKGQKVLDAGCGDGLFSIELAQKGAIVYGVDISEPALNRARSRVQQLQLDHRICLLRASAAQLPFATSYFDSIICHSVLEHIPDDVESLKEMNRVLKPSGRLVLTVPADFETANRIFPRLAKALLRLPRKVRAKIGSRPLVEAESLLQFCSLVIERYNQRFGYSEEDIPNKLQMAGFESTSFRHLLKMFGIAPLDLTDALSCFDVTYTEAEAFGYVAKHEWIIGLCFPIFYAISYLDSILPPGAPGVALGITARKQLSVSQESKGTECGIAIALS